MAIAALQEQQVREKTITNADRIRAMSDKELAKALMKAHDGEVYIRFCKETPECVDLIERGDIPEERCLGCMMDWLLKPAEDLAPASMAEYEKQHSGLFEEE